MDGIPLYSTIQEAIAWAANNGLHGYHEHIYKEQLGYMGSTSHEAAVAGPVVISTPTPIPTSTTTTTTTGGAGGGGGGGY